MVHIPVSFELNGKTVLAFLRPEHPTSTSWSLNVGTWQRSRHWGRINLYYNGVWRFDWNTAGMEAMEDYLVAVLIAWYE